MTDFIEKHRNNFRTYMQRHNLTAYGWAKKAGITEGAIRSYLAGRTDSLTYSTLKKLADAHGTSPSTLLEPSEEYHKGFNDPQYIDRNIFLNSMTKVDDIIAKKNLNINEKDRQKLYFAWYDLKVELLKQSKNDSFDEDRLSSMIKML